MQNKNNDLEHEPKRKETRQWSMVSGSCPTSSIRLLTVKLHKGHLICNHVIDTIIKGHLI